MVLVRWGNFITPVRLSPLNPHFNLPWSHSSNPVLCQGPPQHLENTEESSQIINVELQTSSPLHRPPGSQHVLTAHESFETSTNGKITGIICQLEAAAHCFPIRAAWNNPLEKHLRNTCSNIHCRAASGDRTHPSGDNDISAPVGKLSCNSLQELH